MKRTPKRRVSARLQILIALLSGAGLAAPAAAVVIATGDGSGNTSAPADDPGFANVGKIGSLVGVYLGNRWVLTANHVGANAIVLQGVSYEPVPNTRVRLQTVPEPGGKADLIVYRIQGVPPLPDVVLSDTTPIASDVVTLVGDGWNRTADLTYWDDQWQEVTPPPPPDYTGFKKGTGAAVRWGRNAITASGITVVDPGLSTTYSFYATFDESGGVADEAQAVPGDSGGAVFIERAGQWQLAGILFANTTLPGQPNGTAVFGQASFAADVAFYRDQILAATAPPPVPALSAPSTGALVAGLALAGRRTVRGRRRSR